MCRHPDRSTREAGAEWRDPYLDCLSDVQIPRLRDPVGRFARDDDTRFSLLTSHFSLLERQRPAPEGTGRAVVTLPDSVVGVLGPAGGPVGAARGERAAVARLVEAGAPAEQVAQP